MTVLTLIGRTGKRNQGNGREIGNRNLPTSGLLDAITLTFCLNIILSTYIFIIHP
jgi:hypothetical protein